MREHKADPPEPITPETLAAAEKECLCEESHLELFVLWRAWSALPGAPSIVELFDLAQRPGSAAFIQDVRQILRWLVQEQESETFLSKQRTERGET